MGEDNTIVVASVGGKDSTQATITIASSAAHNHKEGSALKQPPPPLLARVGGVEIR